MDKATIINQLYDIGAVRIGEFTLASGQTSHVYIDLRQIVSYPTLLQGVANAIWSACGNPEAELICGVPYTALPIATSLSLTHNLPMIMVRKEPKKYGTKKQIEGAYKIGQTCLLIEDLVTTGGSVAKTAELLTSESLTVTDMAVLIDRQQGGRENLEAQGYRLHAVMTLSEVFDTLQATGSLSAEEQDIINTHVKAQLS